MRIDKDDTESRVRIIIAEVLGIDPGKVMPDARITDDLEGDSLDIVEILMSMEEEFKFDTSDEEAEKVVTVRDAIDLIRKKTS